MTSIAMAIGMVPTAIGKGMGSEFRSPMAIGVIGGVITSTELTLIVVPIVFSGVERLRFSSLLGLFSFFKKAPGKAKELELAAGATEPGRAPLA